jgi:hypothetical protein
MAGYSEHGTELRVPSEEFFTTLGTLCCKEITQKRILKLRVKNTKTFKSIQED